MVLAETFRATFRGRLWLERHREQWKTPSRGRAIQRCRNLVIPLVTGRVNVTASFGLGASLEEIKSSDFNQS